MRLSNRIMVMDLLRVAPCREPITVTQTLTARINLMACCQNPEFDLCIRQGEDRSFQLVDGLDFTGATEIKFVVRNRNSATELIRYTLSGGDITLPSASIIAFTIPTATSRLLPPGRHWTEVWVTTATGNEVSAKGRLLVQDMKEFDA